MCQRGSAAIVAARSRDARRSSAGETPGPPRSVLVATAVRGGSVVGTGAAASLALVETGGADKSATEPDVEPPHALTSAIARTAIGNAVAIGPRACRTTFSSVAGSTLKVRGRHDE